MSALHLVNKVNGAIDKEISKVPFVGPAFHALWTIETEELDIVTDIAEGDRIDQVVLNHFKRELMEAKALAPYVQTVITFIPGIGPEISGAIGGAVALSEGEPITDVMIAAAAGMVPGGEFAVAAIHVGVDVVEGKKASQIAVDAIADTARAAGLDLPPEAQTLLSAGLQFAQNLANGEKPGDAAIDAAIAALPSTPPALRLAAKAAKRLADHSRLGDILVHAASNMIHGSDAAIRKHFTGALGTGVAFGVGRKIQGIVTENIGSPTVLNRLITEGQQVARTHPVVAAAREAATGLKLSASMASLGVASFPETQPGIGFDIGIALMQKRITVYELASIRDKIPNGEKKAFDIACSLHIGLVTSKPKPQLAPKAAAGFFVTKGMVAANETQRVAMMTSLATVPLAKTGAALAIASVEKERSETWLDRALIWLGLEQE